MELFAYGSLAVKGVMEALTGFQFRAQPACLNGYSRFALKDRIYPGIIPFEKGSVHGKLFSGVDTFSAAVVAHFEDAIYAAHAVTVHLQSGVSVLATTYVVQPQYQNFVTQQSWNEREFITKYRDIYLSECTQFRAQFTSGSAPT
jgi:gamma-glutamylcyclotransferase (GGCT)/AIG2-like uncharacterized protein YtfP